MISSIWSRLRSRFSALVWLPSLLLVEDVEIDLVTPVVVGQNDRSPSSLTRARIADKDVMGNDGGGGVIAGCCPVAFVVAEEADLHSHRELTCHADRRCQSSRGAFPLALVQKNELDAASMACRL
jgi:hypothetical protein